MKRYYTREEVKRLIIEDVKNSIGNQDNNCVMSTIQHATGLSEGEVLQAYIHQRKHPKGEHRWEPGKPPHGNVGREVLDHLGWKEKRLPLHSHALIRINKNTGGREMYPDTAKEVANKYPGGNFMAGTHILDKNGNKVLHVFNIKYGKIHDRHGYANEETPVLGLHHLTKK